MAELAKQQQAPLDVSSSLAVWGHHLRGADLPFVGHVGADVSQAADAASASRLVQASLLALLSAIGKEALTFCFLPIRNALEEFQILGALEALEQAREERLVQFTGIRAVKSPYAVQSVWQFHDAFEAVMIPRQPSGQCEKALLPLAESRRVGVVLSHPLSLGTTASLGHHSSVISAAGSSDPHLSLLASSASKAHTLVGVRSVAEMEASLSWQNHLGDADAVLESARRAAQEAAA